VVLCHKIRDEAAGLAQSLRVGEAVVGSPELCLGAFHVVDVHQHHVPAGDLLVGVSHSERADLKPSIHAVSSAATVVDAVRLARGHRLGECGNHTLEIVGMHGVGHRPVPQFFAGLAEVFENLLAEQLDLSRRVHGHHETRKAFDPTAEVGFDRAQIALGASSVVVDVGVDAAPADDLGGGVCLRGSTAEEPAIDSVEASQPELQLPRLARGGNGSPVLEPLRQIVGMNRGPPCRLGWLTEIEARVLAPASVEELGAPIWQRTPHQGKQ